MAYLNNGTGFQKKLTSSLGVTYYGAGIKDGKKALNTRYLDTSIVVSIHNPITDPSMSVNGSKYDYKNGLEIYLKFRTAKALSKLVRKARALLNEGSDVTPSAITSGANMIEVSDGSKFGLKPAITLCIYGNIDQNKTTNNFDVFQFSRDFVVTNYDCQTGSFDNEEMDTDVESFIDQLNDFAKAATNAIAHCVKKEVSFDMNRFATRQLQVMTKLGIQPEVPRFNSADSWNKSNNYQGGGSVHSASTAEDLDAELDRD